MKSYYNLVKVTIIAFICLCFVFSMAINGEANVSSVSADPNPFYPYDYGTTKISYDLANNAILWLRIYDLSNILVRKLVEPPDRINENQTSGSDLYTIWDGKDGSAALVPEDSYPYHIDDIAWISTSSANAYYVYDLVVDPSNSQILWITDSGGRLLKSTDGGITGSQVVYGGSGPAYGVAISNDGQKIYVLDKGKKKLYYSTNGGSAWGNYSLWSGSNNPYDITCSGDGTILYAVDQYYRYVYKSTNSGASWSPVAYLSGTATKLSGVAVDPNNSNIIMVANVGASGSGSTNATVYKSIDGGSTFTTALYLKGTADGSFKSGNGAYQISIDTNGYYWVSDRGNHRIQQFDSNNNWVMTVGGTSYGDTKYKFDSASTNLGIFITSFGGQQYLYVADYKNKKIKRFAYDNHISFSDPYRRSDLPVSYLVVTTDKDPPDAIANLSTGVVGSDSVQLTWTAPDDAKRYDVRYAKDEITTDAEFEAASHVPGASSQGTTEYFTVRGLESNTTYHFAIKALDEAFNESGISNPPSPSGKTGLLPGWNLVSCPLQPIPDDTTYYAVFKDDNGGAYHIFDWDSTWTGSGDGDPDYAGTWVWASIITPGKGVLLYSQSTNTPTDADGDPIPDSSKDISLSAGWNIIGNPYGTSVNLSACDVVYNGETKSYTEAVNSIPPWIGNAVYIWNGSTYDSFQWDTAKLEPWKGYWIMAYQYLVLKINKP